jgi:hypothetical protein
MASTESPTAESPWQRQWPLLASLGLLAAAVVGLAMLTARQTGGHSLYLSDDAYIHMAVAKNLALHGVWGVTRYGFSGSSSSPLWTLLLAGCYRLLGVRDLIPLALNLIFAVALVIFVHGVLLREGLRPSSRRAAATLAVVFLTSVPLLVFCGMEHTLHVLLVLALCYAAAREFRRPGCTGHATLPALAALAVATRLETLFIIALIGLLGLLRRRWGMVLSLALGGLAPVVAYGLVSRAQGWMWLPNSVLVKGHGPREDLVHYAISLLRQGYGQTLANPHMYAILLAGLFGLTLRLQRPGRFWTVASLVLACFLAGYAMHVQFAVVSRIFVSRYEAYLVALMVFGLALAWADRGPEGEPVARTRWQSLGALVVPVLTGLALLAPLATRAARPFVEVPALARNAYQQQVQMGRFLGAYWPGATVVANDIGALSYYSDIHLLDIAGLGTLETARWILAGQHSVSRLADLATAQHADIAIVYDSWLQTYAGGIPPGWRKRGEWTIPDNIICASPTVAFYAIAPGSDGRLAETLRAFGPQLPAGVQQGGPFTTTQPGAR